MNKQLLNAILRTDFKSFVIKVFNEVSGANEYMDNWHIDVICNELMDMYDGKNNRLIVNVPPRYMKSIICSVALPAFLLGHDPKTNIICVSYSDELATKFANDCRNVMLSDWYCELFPMTHIRQTQRIVNDFRTTRNGGRRSTSIGGPLTGYGGDWIIIDDPLKPQDALSDTQREKVNEWYRSTLYTRLNDKNTGKIMLIMQRLHMNDLTGFLLDGSDEFKHIRLPMIAEQDETWNVTNRIWGKQRVITRSLDELLHPSRDGVDVITKTKDSLGEYAFAGQYQQRPVPIEGGIIKESWLQYYEKLPAGLQPKHLFISWDTASKTGDNNAYSACCVILMTRDYKFYLLDVIRERLDVTALFDRIHTVYNEWKYDAKWGNFVKLLIEDQSSGTQLIQLLQNATGLRGYPFNISAIKPTGDKISRLHGASVLIEKGNILFPKDDEPWWPEFKKELLSFPGSKFKDQVDAFTQCINFAQQMP